MLIFIHHKNSNKDFRKISTQPNVYSSVSSLRAALLFSSFVVDSQQGIEEDDDDQEMVIEVPEQPSGLTQGWFF